MYQECEIRIHINLNGHKSLSGSLSYGEDAKTSTEVEENAKAYAKRLWQSLPEKEYGHIVVDGADGERKNILTLQSRNSNLVETPS